MKTPTHAYLQKYSVTEKGWRPVLFTTQAQTERLLHGLPTTKFSTDFEDGLFESGELEKRQIAVLHNMREGFFYARAVCKQKLPEDVIYSAVYKALEHASRNYRPGTKPGVRFFAYAKPYIRGEICNEWKSLNVVWRGDCVSLGLAQEIDSEDDSEIPVPEGGTVDPAFYEIFVRDILSLLAATMESLTLREQEVIKLVYFRHYLLREVAEHWGVSRSAAQNTLMRAMKKIRKAARGLK